MSEYRRFVAYIYEYQKGKKSANCGFVQVESTGTVCRMGFHIRCRGLVPGILCKIYSFTRKGEWTEGNLLGECRTEKDKIEHILETTESNMEKPEVNLAKISGLILTTEKGGFFGTEWDDHPIVPENFRPEVEIPEKDSTSVPKEKDTEQTESYAEPETQETSPGVEAESKTQKTTSEAETTTQETFSEAETESSSVKEIHAQSLEVHPGILPGTPCESFDDGEMAECRKIALEDLNSMGRRFCMLKNNRFLQYGYSNFHHLLLCRNNRGQYILGVPGRYDQQECFMAGMFGFPYFKESREIQVPDGKGGYWYRSVNAPDFH